MDCYETCSLSCLGPSNTSVQFAVTSLNAIGYSLSMSPSATVLLVPGTPSPPTVTAFAASLEVIGDFSGTNTFQMLPVSTISADYRVEVQAALNFLSHSAG